MSHLYAIPVAISVCCVTLLSSWAVRKVLTVPVHKRPRLALLERWYAASPKRRRVIAAVFGWEKDVEGTRQALNLLTSKYPALASNFNEKNEWIASTVPFDVEVFESERWQQVSERLLSEDMTSSRKLFRVGFSKSDKTLVLMLDHVLTDGQGLAGLVQALVQDEKGMDSEEGSLPLVLEEHVDMTPRLGLLLKHIIGDMIKKKGIETFKGPLFLGEERSLEDQSLLEDIRLDPDRLRSLSLRSKAEKTSIHGALCAAASIALTKVAPAKDGALFDLHSPISLRGKGPFQSALGNYVGPSEVKFSPGDFKNAWDLARHVKDEIEIQRPNAEPLMGQISLLSDLKSFLDKKEALPLFARSATLEVSNLGRCSTSQEWAFSQGNHYVGPLLVVNAVASSNGALWLTITARSLCVNRAALQAYRDALLLTLEDMSK